MYDAETAESKLPGLVVTGYFAWCADCKVEHPCKIIIGEIRFAPDHSFDCPNRGEQAPTHRWSPSPLL